MGVEESFGGIHLEYEEARQALAGLDALADSEPTRAAKNELSALMKKRSPGHGTGETARVARLALDGIAQRSADNNRWSKFKEVSERLRARASG